MTIYSVTLEEDPINGDLILPIPPDVLAALNLKEGDELNWLPQEDGSVIMQKIKPKETELVLVSTIQTFRVDYVMEVPIGKKEYALDTACDPDKCTEFHQEYIGDQIVSHRVITESEVCNLARENNKSSIEWQISDAQIIEDFVTREPT